MIENYVIILYDSGKPLDESHAHRFFVSKEKYQALQADATEILIGTVARWKIASRAVFFIDTMICNYHCLVMVLDCVEKNEFIHYSEATVQHMKQSDYF